MNDFNMLLYQIFQFCYTTCSKFIIPLVPILLYHLSYFGKTNYRIHKERINDICQAKSNNSLVHLCLTDVLFSTILHSLQFFVCHLHILSCQYDDYAIHYCLTWTRDNAFFNI